ncbi:MAG: DUF177 domain-containing protein [Prevotella sp.]|nr:DUF177 domain-containing protein [Prevotella sp.]
MSKSGTYEIDLKSLKEEPLFLEYDLDDRFFASLDGAQLEHGALHVSASIRKTAGLFELRFHTEGTVTVSCDLCLDDMDQPISTDNGLTVRFGPEYAEDDDMITVSEVDGTLDLSWFIYEFIVLAIPIKHVHAPGKCNHAMTQKLEELSAVRSSDEAQEVDPRWSALEKLRIKD